MNFQRATLSCGVRKNPIRHERIVRKDAITFENGNRAVVVMAPRDASVKEILDALEIASPRALILLFGGAAGLDESRKAHLATLFCRWSHPGGGRIGRADYRWRHTIRRHGDNGRGGRETSRDMSAARNRTERENRPSGNCRRVRRLTRRCARTTSLPFRFGGKRRMGR